MEEREQSEEPGYPQALPMGAGLRALIGLLVTVTILYFGREVLMPLAVAALLAIVISPVVARLERYVGRAVASFLVLILVLGFLVQSVYFFAIELGQVATEVTSFSDEIAKKVTDLEKGASPIVLQVERVIDTINSEIGKALPGRAQVPGRMVTVQQAPAGVISKWLSPAAPLALILGETLLTCILMFFLLYDRYGLRDRIVRIAARQRVIISSEAIESAATAVGRYLMLFSTINLVFGLLVGFAMWSLGMPNPELWGAMAFALRYLPYIGAAISAILPTAVAFAIFPGFGRAIEVLGIFLALDQIAANFVEPFLIGPGIGLAPFSVLLAAIFWGWVWGPVGLIIATPITVCLKIAGDYVPSLRFLSILLGNEVGREEYHDYYRKLLEQDADGARQLVLAYSGKEGLEKTYQEVLSPALLMTRSELALGNISRENARLIFETSGALVDDIGQRFIKPRRAPKLKILGVPSAAERESLSLSMLLELLRFDGFAASTLEQAKSPAEALEFVARYTPDLVLISACDTNSVAPALEVVKALHQSNPGLPVIAGGEEAFASARQFLDAGCVQVLLSFVSAHQVVSRYAHRRVRVRRGLDPAGDNIESAPGATQTETHS